jgi:hypothetical protein
MGSTDIFAANSLVWPLCFLLVALIVLKQLREDVRPIFVNVVAGVAKNAQGNALFYAMAMMIGTLSSLQALADVAREFHWVYVEAIAKILQPGLAAVVGLMMRTPGNIAVSTGNPPPTSSTTTPPFPTLSP